MNNERDLKRGIPAPRFVQIAFIPHEVWGNQLAALGDDGFIYIETHGMVENKDTCFWSVLDWQVSPHRRES